MVVMSMISQVFSYKFTFTDKARLARIFNSLFSVANLSTVERSDRKYCQPMSLQTGFNESPYQSVSNTANDESTYEEQISVISGTSASNSEYCAYSIEDGQSSDAAANTMLFSTPVMIRVLPMDIISSNVNTVERKRRFDKIVAALPIRKCVRKQLEKGFSNLHRIKSLSSSSHRSSTMEKAENCQSPKKPAECAGKNDFGGESCCLASVCRDDNTMLRRLLGQRRSRPRSSISENSSVQVSELF